ncbi:Beclin-1-like protein [Camellia lanceoleosa]|uniref:Beclin-1-like protein n=1 Tax=Camellia lanceoleosa TaxID=1840588 RepID=A0ACC0G2Y6_9ERIC|nr:Beclin-1-like protein [Camellia lanceoleosa]
MYEASTDWLPTITGEIRSPMGPASVEFIDPRAPVVVMNLFWSTRYDKAMTLFLTCLKEFAEFANSKDKENNISVEMFQAAL